MPGRPIGAAGAGCCARCREASRVACALSCSIDVTLPPSLPKDEGAALLAADLERGRALKAAGSIVDIWRIPGAVRNVGIWEAGDATVLHELIESLPLFTYLRAEVTALARHPIEPA